MRQNSSFHCPANSYFNGDEWPPVNFAEDCTCFVGYAKSGARCVQSAAKPGAEQQQTNTKDEMVWTCSDGGENCSAACPRNSWARSWPVTSFDDCSCDWGYQRVAGLDALTGACLDPETVSGNTDAQATTFSLDLPRGRQWTCGKLITQADSIAQLVKQKLNATAVTIVSDCELPLSRQSRRLNAQLFARAADGFDVDVFFADMDFSEESEMEEAADFVSEIMLDEYGSDIAPIMAAAAEYENFGDLVDPSAESAASGDQEANSRDSLDLNFDDTSSGTSTPAIVGGVSAAFCVLVIAAFVVTRRRKLSLDASAACDKADDISQQSNPMYSHAKSNAMNAKPSTRVLKHSHLHKQESVAVF